MKTILLLIFGGLSWQIAAAPLDLELDVDSTCVPNMTVTTARETSLLALVASLPCVSQPILHVDDGDRPFYFMLRRALKIESQLVFADRATFEDGVTASGKDVFLPIKSAGGEALPALEKCRFCKILVSRGDLINADLKAYRVLALFVNSEAHIVAQLEDEASHSVSFKDLTFSKFQVTPAAAAKVESSTHAEHVLSLNPLFTWFTERRLITDPRTQATSFESGEGSLNPRLIFHEKSGIFATALNRVDLPWDHEVLLPGDRLRISSGVVRVLKLFVNGTVTASAAKVQFENDGATGFISLSNQDSALELGKNTEPAVRGPRTSKMLSGRELRAILAPKLAL